MNGDPYTQTNLDSMKHLKRFNENSHDWRANAFPGATEEEIEAEIQKIEAERKAKNPQSTQPTITPKAVPAKKMTEEEEENYYRSTGWATGDYGQYRNQSTDSKKEEEKEVEEEKPTLGSKIKSFFGFNK
jgi:hypothetical protein